MTTTTQCNSQSYWQISRHKIESLCIVLQQYYSPTILVHSTVRMDLVDLLCEELNFFPLGFYGRRTYQHGIILTNFSAIHVVDFHYLIQHLTELINIQDSISDRNQYIFIFAHLLTKPLVGDFYNQLSIYMCTCTINDILCIYICVRVQ